MSQPFHQVNAPLRKLHDARLVLLRLVRACCVLLQEVIYTKRTCHFHVSAYPHVQDTARPIFPRPPYFSPTLTFQVDCLLEMPPQALRQASIPRLKS
jgi:hypothetical protein